MTAVFPVITLSPRDYDAVLFDLDGVLTRTASVHAVVWKKLFDSFLEQRATQAGEPFVPFDIAADYPRYVDGKPRYDGVTAFLESRGIELPLGAPEDGPDVQSVRALGNLKDRYFVQQMEQHGVEPYEAAIALVRKLRDSEAGSYYARHRLYRASVTLASRDTDVRIGRQRIAWGTGRFWSPLDILNPINPIQLEREERLGVDAVLVERKLGALSRLSAVYAPQHASGASSAALLWHDNAAGVDYSIVVARFLRENVVGADVATQLGEAGLRAELTHARREGGTDYRRALLGLDYAFPNTLTLSGEFYHNGAGAADRGSYDFASLLAGRIQNVGRRYLGTYASYEITPLLKWANYLVVNLADHSRYFSPSLTYSIKTNLDWSVGVQLFRGSNGSEYGRFNDVYYTQLQWFF